ncbi:hypothetical protein DID88_003393 [Monilinia fructigena]|uniref:CS domain-containing protein n=1 Tax=Monilinia fructigena TaxID=38457 RepID=A0A395IUP4_9HELO|nr:hypothetical protein DID88_003393 [Monilinia fructigena]
MAQKCVHQSCGKVYTDPEEDCLYHPGPPIFHEGQKGWKCCKPRTIRPRSRRKQPPETPTAASSAPSPAPEPSRAPIAPAPQSTATPPPPPPESEDDDASLEIPWRQGKSGEGGEEILETVRHDFYQTATSVIASFFLKKVNKDKAVISFSAPHELTLDLPTTDVVPKRYKTIVPLFGAIDTKASSFKIMGTKLEVTLVKADGASWPVFRK